MNLYIVTVRLPRNPEHPAALRCNHSKIKADHCAEMGCPNYISSCPFHTLLPREGAMCNRSKRTDTCPAGTGLCTDVTGEEHSYLIQARNTLEAQQGAELRLSPGAHVARIEATDISLNLL